MGVLSCDRNGCNNIMCDRHSREYGYICSECFDELIESGSETNIANFMQSRKGHVNKEAARARFEIEFPER
jgi:hypothetical protein